MSQFIYYCAECHYAEYRILFIIILNAIMLSAAMLNVIIASLCFLSHFIYHYTECHYAVMPLCRYVEYRYAECHYAEYRSA